MKKYLLLFLLISSVSFSQKKTALKKGVKIIEVNKKIGYQTPKSILFEFKGKTHLIHHFLGLSKKIKRAFKRKGVKVDFNYNLSDKNPWKNDLKDIPSIKHSPKGYEAHCFLEVNNFKILKKNKKGIYIGSVPNAHKSKIYHELNVILKKENITVLIIKLEIISLSTIASENKKISKELRKIIIAK